MLMFGLISQDKALVDGFLEQIKQMPEWQATTFDTTEAAMAVWKERTPPLVIWDMEQNNSQEAQRFYKFLNQNQNKPWFLTIGNILLSKESAETLDNLEKPVRLGKMLARLQFYKRRLQQPENKIFSLASFQFYPRQNKLVRDGIDIKLTDKESALLEYIAAAENPVSREILLEDIWGYGPAVDTHTLETHIYRLRQKLMAHKPDGEDCFIAAQGSYLLNQKWATS